MVVVVLTAGGALLALRAFNKTRETNPERLDKALFGIKQQAGVMAAICTAVFGVISALQSAKLAGSSYTEKIKWGSGKHKADRIVDLVDEMV